MQLLLQDVVTALERAWRCEVIWHRASPIVTVHDNYDALGYPPDGAARDERYSRYVTQDTLLRTQTSAMLPGILSALSPTLLLPNAVAPQGLCPAGERESLVVCPGLVYRRDVIDRLHTGEPHQVDLWKMGEGALLEMAELVITAALPGREWRTTPAQHPYTREGLQLDVREGDEWVEIGECGIASPALVSKGLAMGLGLDRLLMLRKGIPDIRLLRSADPRIATQMLDLAPWRAVSRMPPVRRDLSIATTELSAEILGDRVREALKDSAPLVESVAVLSTTPARELPGIARERLGMSLEQHNVLLRVVLRSNERTLTHAECNELRNQVYAALHEGTRATWAAR